MQNTQIQQISEKFERIQELLEPWNELYRITDNNGKTLDMIRDITDRFLTEATADADDQRTLRIGIVGQMKAGKSSFLNALLFSGEDILPKAATPMTAALTEIAHGDYWRAIITYYRESDWKQIENAAEEVYKQIDHYRAQPTPKSNKPDNT